MKGRKEKRKLMKWCGGTVWIFIKEKKKKSFNITRLRPMSFKCSPIQPCLFFIPSSAQRSPSLPTAASIKPVCADCWGGTNSNFLWYTHKERMGLWILGCACRLGGRKCMRGPSVHDGGQSSGGRPGSFVCNSCCHGNAYSATSGRRQLLDFCV